MKLVRAFFGVLVVASTLLACGVASSTRTPILALTALPFSSDTPKVIRPTTTPDPMEGWELLGSISAYSIFRDHDTTLGGGHGVKVYSGNILNTAIFEIVGGGNCAALPSGQGYLVRYPDDGSTEWKDRGQMDSLNLWVKKDDSLTLHDWKWYGVDCP